MRSRARAGLYVLATGVALTALALVIRTLVGDGSTTGETWARALPMALVYYAPSAVVLGWGMTRLMDRRAIFGWRLLWAIGGLLVAAPVIWLVQTLGLPPFDAASVHIAAVVSGMAGRLGYRQVPA